MCSLRTVNTRILKGMQIHHNFIREPEDLGGNTPAIRAGIKVKGGNK